MRRIPNVTGGKSPWLVGHAPKVLFVALMLTAHEASAEDPERAAQLFEQGMAEFGREEYRAAAASFMRAYELAPHGAPLYNAGLALQAAGEAPRAADAYDLALESEGLNPAQQKDARARLIDLELSLGRLDVQGPTNSTLSVAHVVDVELPARVHVTPGRHELRVRFADGTTQTRDVEVAARATSILFEPLRSAPVPAHTPPAPTKPEPPPAEEPSWGNTLGWVSVGAAGVAAGGAAFFGLRALDAQDAFEESGYRSQDARDRAVRYQNWTNASWIACGVFGVTGVTLLLTSNGSNQIEDATPSISGAVGPASVGVVGRF